MKQKFAIVGAGIAGLTTAYMLDRLGFDYHLYEADQTVRGIGAGMGLASNAIKGFEYLDLDQEVISVSNYLQKFEIADYQGKKIFAADTEKIKKNYRTDNYAVHRADLHQLLLSKLDLSKISTNKRLKRFKIFNDKVELEFEDQTKENFNFLIGADGVNSQIRQQLIPESNPRYAGYWCWRAVIENQDLELDSSYEIWGKQGRFGMTPLTQNRIYWYACINSNLQDGIQNYTIEDLRERFQNFFPTIRKILNQTEQNQLISSPIVDIKPIEKYSFGKILLIGDAAHATTPNMGQGACQAIEDVAVLQDELMKNSVLEAFNNFEKRRMKRTRYITKTSWNAGKLAQSDAEFVIFLRNQLLRILPSSLAQFPLKDLLEKDFMKL